MKHKHSDVIKAWADGAQVEYLYTDTMTWHTTPNPQFSSNIQYRIKPEAKPDIVKRFYLESNPLVGHRFSEAYTDKDLVNKHSLIKCTFDGETTKLKFVEVI